MIKRQSHLHERVGGCGVETRIWEAGTVAVHHIVSAALGEESYILHHISQSFRHRVTLLMDAETNWHSGRLRSLGSIS